MDDKLRRTTIYMSQQLYEYYEAIAKETGLTVSSAMVVALKQYVDTQNGLKMLSNMTVMNEMLGQMKKQLNGQNDSHNAQLEQRG